MSQPITWQNVGTAAFRGISSNAMDAATRSFAVGAKTLQDTLQSANDTVKQNWETGKKNNTEAFLNEVAKYHTVEEAQAAQATLAALREGYGGQIDQAAARTAQEGMVEALQRKATAAQQFEQGNAAHATWQKENPQKEYVTQMESLIAGADPKALAELKAALPAYAESFSGNQMGALTKALAAREQGLVTEERAKQKFESDMASAKTTRVHQENQDRIAEARLRAEQESNRLTREAREAERTGALGTKKAQAEEAARQALFKSSVLGDGTLDGLEGRKTLVARLKDTYNLSDNAVNDVIENVYGEFAKGTTSVPAVGPDGKPLKDAKGNPVMEDVPIPVRSVLDAVGASSEAFNGSFWSRRGDRALDNLKGALDNPALIKDIRSALYLRDKGAYSTLASPKQ